MCKESLFAYTKFIFQPYLCKPYPYLAFILYAPAVAVLRQFAGKPQTMPAVGENVQFAIYVMFS